MIPVSVTSVLLTAYYIGFISVGFESPFQPLAEWLEGWKGLQNPAGGWIWYNLLVWILNLKKYLNWLKPVNHLSNGCTGNSPASWAFLWCRCQPLWAPGPERKSRGREHPPFRWYTCRLNVWWLKSEQKSQVEMVNRPQGRSCPSSPSPPPGAWWRFLWRDRAGYASSGASHSWERCDTILLV